MIKIKFNIKCLIISMKHFMNEIPVRFPGSLRLGFSFVNNVPDITTDAILFLVFTVFMF